MSFLPRAATPGEILNRSPDVSFELLSFSGPDELARAAARDWLARIADAPQFTVALSGGRIATNLFSATAKLARDFPSIHKVQFFWADERCVPPDHPDSSYRTARELLFEPLKIPPANIHRIRGEDPPPAAAQAITTDLLRITTKNARGIPVFDLIFLGMGEDGHVASLFPGAPPHPGIYYPVIGPKPPPQRITLSYSVIAAAHQVWVLASGPGKEEALGASLQPDGKTPLAQVLRSRAETKIFSDVHL
jgi:6-phosphogluconolactonase